MIKNFMNVGIPTTTRCTVYIKQNAGVDDPRELDDNPEGPASYK